MVSVIWIKAGVTCTCIGLNCWLNLVTQQNQETFGGKKIYVLQWQSDHTICTSLNHSYWGI